MMRIYLQKSVAHVAHYAEASAKYNSDVPISTNCTFAEHRNYLIIAESNRLLAAPAPTASSTGYAAATKSGRNDEILSLQTEVAALKLSAGGALPQNTPYTQHYCWTYGMCKQPRSGRIFQKTGHDITATRAKPGIGGNTWGL